MTEPSRGSSREPADQGAFAVRPPEHLNSRHDLAQFRNGKHPSLDEWLQKLARPSEGLSARTYVVCSANEPTRVVGYYAISNAMESRAALPNAKLRKGMPSQIPLLLIGRLAVDINFQGRALGTDLLSHALQSCLRASEISGVRGVVTHAIDGDAVRFYNRGGLDLCPILGERVMFATIEKIRALFVP